MSSLSPLTTSYPLESYATEIKGITVAKVIDQAIVSVAISKENDAEFAKAIKKSYKLVRPSTGLFTQAKTDNVKLLGLQKDQLFIMFDYDGDRAVEVVNKKLNSKDQIAYLSDQSDSWVTLRVSGDNCRDALERICPIDIHPSAFPVGTVARTSMEHMGVIIAREDENAFLLMTLRSFAKSFLHAVDTSIHNI